MSGDVNAILADLVSPSTIAARLGVSRAAVANWSRTRDVGFPAPLDAPGIAGAVYSWAAVSAWHEARVAADVARVARRADAIRSKIASLEAELERLEP